MELRFILSQDEINLGSKDNLQILSGVIGQSAGPHPINIMFTVNA
jgi:hypothetical protein